jgi:hypothetical protein
MLWKELFIERVGTLGRLGRWLGVLLTIAVGGGSLGLSAVVAWSYFGHGETAWSDWAVNQMSILLQDTGMLLGWLIQWGMGLRAAVSIASERERATWDALLMSPLEPAELLSAKLYGALFALRWLIGAILLAWILGVAIGAVTPGTALVWVGSTAVAGLFMAALGIRCSIALPTATRAMTWTIALWLISLAGVAATAFLILGLCVMLLILIWLYAIQLMLIPPNSPPWFPLTWQQSWPLLTNAISLLMTILIVLDTRLRFDRLAGRMAGGPVEAAVDAWLHGQPRQPVLLESRPAPASQPSGKALELDEALSG